MSLQTAARGVTQVVHRCEDAKTSSYLDLSECQLMYVADAIFLVLKDCDIQKCSLKNNALKKIPKKLFEKFPNMKVINLEGNHLVEVDAEISQWTSLKGISLARNQLSKFPSEVYKAKELTLLDISYNAIQEIDLFEICDELPVLKQINIAGNPFTSSAHDHILKCVLQLSNRVIIKF